MHPPAAVAATTREQLLTVAADLLQRVGYASFSFRDLADAVGIRAASVHYHFPTKADLGLALVDWFRAQSDPQMAALCQAHPNVRDRLLALAEQVAEHTCTSGKSCPINLLLSEFSVLPENLQIKVRAWVDDCLAGMAAWLDQGRQAFTRESSAAADILPFYLQDLDEYNGTFQPSIAAGPFDRNTRTIVNEVYGYEAIRMFTEVKSTWVRLTEPGTGWYESDSGMRLS